MEAKQIKIDIDDEGQITLAEEDMSILYDDEGNIIEEGEENENKND